MSFKIVGADENGNFPQRVMTRLGVLFAGKAVQELTEGSGRLTVSSLNNAYASKAVQTAVETGRLSQAELDADYAAKGIQSVVENGRLSEESLNESFTGRWNYDQIVFLSDSIFAGTTPELVDAALPWADVVKIARSGYTSTEVAALWGAPFRLNNFTVLANTSETAVTVVAPTSEYRGAEWVGELTGDNLSAPIPGTLVRTASDFRFKRTTAGTATPVTNPVFRCTEFDAYKNATLVVTAGRNNITNPDIVVRDFNAIIRAHNAPQSAILFLPIPLGNNEESYKENHWLVQNVNKAIQKNFPSNFYNDAEYFIERGLTASGITPTTNDLTRIGFQTVPDSLLSDGLHLNTAGNRVKATAILNGLDLLGALKGDRLEIPGISNRDPQLPLMWSAKDIEGAKGNPIAFWYDKYGRKMIQNGGSAQPTLVVENGEKWLRFDGVDDEMLYNISETINQPITIIARIRLRSTAGKNHGIFWGGQTFVLTTAGNPAIGSGPVHGASVPINTPTIVYAVMNGATGAQVGFDNQAPANASMPSAAAATTNFRVGYSFDSAARYSNIDVSHFYIFAGAMPNAAVQNVGNTMF